MLRQLPSLAVLLVVFVPAVNVWGQIAAPTKSGSQQSQGNAADSRRRKEQGREGTKLKPFNVDGLRKR